MPEVQLSAAHDNNRDGEEHFVVDVSLFRTVTFHMILTLLSIIAVQRKLNEREITLKDFFFFFTKDTKQQSMMLVHSNKWRLEMLK